MTTAIVVSVKVKKRNENRWNRLKQLKKDVVGDSMTFEEFLYDLAGINNDDSRDIKKIRNR